jgi:hypothetical protein
VQFFIEFRANWAIRVICALWFVSMVMIGGAGRMFAQAGGAVWDVLVPPARVHAIFHPPKPAPPTPVVTVVDATVVHGESDAEMRARKAGWGAGTALDGMNAGD